MDNNNRGHSRCFPFLINIKVPAGDHHLLLGHKNDIFELWCSHGRRRGIEQSELYCVAVQHICQENQPLNGTYVDLYSHWMLVLHCLKFCVQSLVCSSGGLLSPFVVPFGRVLMDRLACNLWRALHLFSIPLFLRLVVYCSNWFWFCLVRSGAPLMRVLSNRSCKNMRLLLKKYNFQPGIWLFTCGVPCRVVRSAELLFQCQCTSIGA